MLINQDYVDHDVCVDVIKSFDGCGLSLVVNLPYRESNGYRTPSFREDGLTMDG